MTSVASLEEFSLSMAEKSQNLGAELIIFPCEKGSMDRCRCLAQRRTTQAQQLNRISPLARSKEAGRAERGSIAFLDERCLRQGGGGYV